MLYGQGILITYVDIPLVRADGIGTDNHALDNTVRISFEDAPVLIGAGVTLVGVAEYILNVIFGGTAGLPFPPRGEAAAAPAP